MLVLALGASTGMAANTISSAAVVPPPAKAHVAHYSGAASIAVFKLASNAKITIGANTMAGLNALSVGEVARVSYTIENGVWLAHKVVVNPVHHEKTSTCQPHPAKANELHAHGKITSYDASAGTISIQFHR